MQIFSKDVEKCNQLLMSIPELYQLEQCARGSLASPCFFYFEKEVWTGEIPRLDFIKIGRKVQDTKHKLGANRSPD